MSTAGDAPPGPADSGRDPYAALRHAGYRRFLAGNLLANQAAQACRFAEAEAAAAPKRKDSAVLDAVKDVLKEKPPEVE